MKKFTVLLVLSLSCVLALGGCGKKNKDKTDLTSSHTTASTETMAPTTAAPETTNGSSEKETPKESETEKVSKQDGTSASSVTSSIHTYTSGKVSIEYPVIANLSQASVQEKVNKLLNEHALEILDAYSVDNTKDTLTVKCSVKNADRKRITAVYTGSYTADGAAYPLNLFYTNTIDTALGEDMELTDYADPYTLAGYVLSDDCQFYQADSTVEKELRALKNKTDIDTYTGMFRHADFPYKAQEENKKEGKFPEVFSYEEQGTIYVSIPVPHDLGDYALIKYTPDTK